MYHKIIVPLDGSRSAENVLPYARVLARGLKIPVELLGVLDLADMVRNVSAADGLFLDTLAADELRRRRDYLSQVAKSFAGAAVTIKIEKGQAASVIIDGAAADKNSLICMATHGRSGLNRWLLGSVAEKILRGANAPVLLIRAAEAGSTEGEKRFEGVIVPLDGSAVAEQVLPVAAELAKTLDLEVTLFRAYQIPYGVYEVGGSYAIDIARLGENIEKDVQRYLEERCHALRQAGLERISYASTEGFGADEIIKYGRKNPNKLIAMCSHGRSGVKRWMLGSVTETAVRHSGGAVLIVRAA